MQDKQLILLFYFNQNLCFPAYTPQCRSDQDLTLLYAAMHIIN